jgi:3-(3-hydroxy-phenyl)propionate hydroxylase
MRLPHEQREALDVADRAWELLEPWDVHPGNAHLERHAVYTFNARYATKWRAGRGLIAGDAAHLMPPFAGQGMCAGVRDAANLSWKLGLVLDGVAEDSLLDTYDTERLPSVTTAIEFSMELGKVICVPDPDEAARRDAAMAAGVRSEPMPAPGLPAITSGFLHPTAPHAGRQFVQGCVGRRRFDDVYGNGWRLVTIDPALTADALGADDRVWFESIGGRVVTLAEPDDSFRRWFTEHDTTVALQRPDFYVYGTASSPAGATELLTRLRHSLRTGIAS